jgi:hypothetical protein
MTRCRGVAEAVLEAGAAHVRVLVGSMRLASTRFGGRAAREESPSPRTNRTPRISAVGQSIAHFVQHFVRSETFTLGPRPFQPHPVRMRTLVQMRRACRPRDGPGGP